MVTENQDSYTEPVVDPDELKMQMDDLTIQISNLAQKLQTYTDLKVPPEQRQAAQAKADKAVADQQWEAARQAFINNPTNTAIRNEYLAAKAKRRN
jgi:hypothetical protein